MIAFFINRLLSQDPEVAAKLFAHHSKVLQIDLVPLNITFFVFIESDNIRVSRVSQQPADTIIRGTPLNLIAQKDLEISGDLELAQTLQYVSQKLAIDWEDILSHYTNDYVAYGLRKAIHPLKNLSRIFSRNVKDYMEEEQRLIVSREEVNDFCKDVDDVRDAVERLSAKIAMIES